MANTPPSKQLRQVAAELAEPKPMRRGSVSERTVKCSKPGCACAKDPRHAMALLQPRTAVEGKTQSRFLTSEQAALARQQIETGHAFRTKVEAFWQGCEDWADRELQAAPPSSASTSSQEAEKRGSQRTSRRKSSGRSKPS